MKMAKVSVCDENIKLICRACLRNDTKRMFSIYDQLEKDNENEEAIIIQDLFNHITAIEIKEVENEIELPTLICANCIEALQLVLDFKRLCTKSERILNNYVKHKLLGNKDSDSDDDDLKDLEVFENFNVEVISLKNEEIIKESKELDDQNGTHSNCSKENESISEEALSDVKDNNDETLCESADGTISSTSTTKIYRCPLCSKKMLSEYTLDRHIARHAIMETTCKICNKTFGNKSRLKAHLRSHSDEKPYTCEVCLKQSQQPIGLHFHRRKHTGEKPYECKECGKKFIQNSELKQHMITHTKEKPFMCNICGIRLRSKLVEHMRQHTGEKPFECGFCKKSFSTATVLKEHELIHKGLRPHRCDVCNKTFRRKTHLRTHYKIHTNQRDHVCSLCGKGFIQAHCLRAHLEKH